LKNTKTTLSTAMGLGYGRFEKTSGVEIVVLENSTEGGRRDTRRRGAFICDASGLLDERRQDSGSGLEAMYLLTYPFVIQPHPGSPYQPCPIAFFSVVTTPHQNKPLYSP
jgi:hypothetical protein